MALDKSDLLTLLKEVGNVLRREVHLIAVGGTAMTLLGMKRSTIDIDFVANREDGHLLKKALQTIPHGFKVDVFFDGMVFSQQLPEDYVRKSIPFLKIKNIRLSSLHPLDIVVTKIGRLDERDLDDIEACIQGFRLRKEEIMKRAKTVEYVGREENYRENVRYVLKRFFP